MVETFVKKHKILNKNIDQWFYVYNKFRELEPSAVNILDVDSKFITMEKIDISKYVYIVKYLLNDHLYVNEVTSNYFKLISNMCLFQNSYPFMYQDLHGENILVNKENGNIILLDPDSFFLYNPKKFYTPGKDKDVESMVYFEARLKFLNLNIDILNAYFTNKKNWSRLKKFKI